MHCGGCVRGLGEGLFLHCTHWHTRHFGVLQTLDEMKRVLPSDGSFGDFRAFKDLTYMDWVLKEAMRLYNPVPVITRQSTCDTALQGVPIPAGVSANNVGVGWGLCLSFCGEPLTDSVGMLLLRHTLHSMFGPSIMIQR